MQLLHEIVPISGQQVLVDPDARPSTRMIYTNGVTLWMLILVRQCEIRDLKRCLFAESVADVGDCLDVVGEEPQFFAQGQNVATK